MELALEGLFSLVTATAVGSFLGALGARLAVDFRQGGDGHDFRRLLSGRSICACGARPLTVLEVIPIIGFLSRRGRCHSCAVILPSRETAAEATALMGAALMLLAGASGIEALLFGAAAAAALMLAWIDQEQAFLPDALLLALAGLGVLQAAFDLGGLSWGDRALGALAGGGLAVALRWIWLRWRGVEALGLGDVKLLAIAGLWVGIDDLPVMIAIGAGATLAATIARKGFDRSHQAPLGPGMLAAFLGVLFWRSLQG